MSQAWVESKLFKRGQTAKCGTHFCSLLSDSTACISILYDEQSLTAHLVAPPCNLPSRPGLKWKDEDHI
jgi:hypothetical protein